MTYDWQAPYARRRTIRLCWPGLQPISMRCWRSPCRRCRSTTRSWRRRARRSAAFRWRRASIRASSPCGRTGLAAVAAERRAWTRRPACLRASVGQEAERWHTGLPDRRRIPQGAAAGLAGGRRAKPPSESWVMGQKVPVSLDDAQQTDLANSVVALYSQPTTSRRGTTCCRISKWRRCAACRRPRRISSSSASPQSPMKDLLTAIARQLTLSEPPKPRRGGGGGSGGKEGGRRRAAATRGAAALSSLLSASPVPHPRSRPATRSRNTTSHCATWSQ